MGREEVFVDLLVGDPQFALKLVGRPVDVPEGLGLGGVG